MASRSPHATTWNSAPRRAVEPPRAPRTPRGLHRPVSPAVTVTRRHWIVHRYPAGWGRRRARGRRWFRWRWRGRPVQRGDWKASEACCAGRGKSGHGTGEATWKAGDLRATVAVGCAAGRRDAERCPGTDGRDSTGGAGYAVWTAGQRDETGSISMWVPGCRDALTRRRRVFFSSTCVRSCHHHRFLCLDRISESRKSTPLPSLPAGGFSSTPGCHAVTAPSFALAVRESLEGRVPGGG